MPEKPSDKPIQPIYGTCGECTWAVDTNGLLEIYPANGAMGMLDDMEKNLYKSPDNSGDTVPWKNFREAIVRVKIKPGVVADKKVDNMFSGCKNLVSLDLNGFDTSNVTDMTSMFEGCYNITSLDLSSFNTSNAADMNRMFKGCSKLCALDLSAFGTGNVMSMGSMFSDCYSLKTLDLSGFDTSNVKFMDSMFCDCCNLTELNLSNFNTSKVIDMSKMFSGCEALTVLDLSIFDTSNIWHMNNMFKGCAARKYILGENFVFSTDEDDNKRQTGLPNLSEETPRGHLFTGKWFAEDGRVYTGEQIPNGAGVYIAMTRSKDSFFR